MSSPRRSSLGRSEAICFPAVTFTSRLILRIGRGCSVATIMGWRAMAKGSDPPSRSGTSGPSISTLASVMPRPENAAIRCSTVEILQLRSGDSKEVHSAEAFTWRCEAGMAGTALGGAARKLMPEPAEAGCTVARAGTPLCKPTPCREAKSKKSAIREQAKLRRHERRILGRRQGVERCSARAASSCRLAQRRTHHAAGEQQSRTQR